MLQNQSGAAPLATIMRGVRRLQPQGPSSGGKPRQRGNVLSSGAIVKQPRGRKCQRGNAAVSPSSSPAPSGSESSPEPSHASKSRKFLASSSPSSAAAKAKGALRKGHYPLTPKSPSTPSKKFNMSVATPSTEVSIFTHVVVQTVFIQVPGFF